LIEQDDADDQSKVLQSQSFKNTVSAKTLPSKPLTTGWVTGDPIKEPEHELYQGTEEIIEEEEEEEVTENNSLARASSRLQDLKEEDHAQEIERRKQRVSITPTIPLVSSPLLS
jgi:hypothetical protein